MVDNLSQNKRSKVMRSIKGKDTKPELIIRKALHQKGFRYVLHDKSLPGKPDIVLPKYRAIVQVNGCFWHGHDCHIFKLPRQLHWREKIHRNRERDSENIDAYKCSGWRVLVVWECALQGKSKLPIQELKHSMTNWLLYDGSDAEIKGRPEPTLT